MSWQLKEGFRQHMSNEFKQRPAAAFSSRRIFDEDKVCRCGLLAKNLAGLFVRQYEKNKVSCQGTNIVH